MLSFILLAATAFTGTDADATVARVYPLGAVLDAGLARSVAVETLPLSDNYSGVESSGAFGESGALNSDQLMDMARNVVRPGEWDMVGRSMQAVGDDLLVEAPEAVHADLRRFLEYVASVTGRAATVRCDVYFVPDLGAGIAPAIGPASPALAGEIGKLASAKTIALVRSFRVALRSGRPQGFSAIERKNYVHDYDVEIAEAAGIAQPILKYYGVGIEGGLKADMSSDGSALITFALRNVRERGAPQLYESSTPSLIATDQALLNSETKGVAQSPQLAFAALCGSVRLEKGQTATALATSLDDAGTARTGVLVGLTLEDLPAMPGAFECGEKELRLVPVAGDCARAVEMNDFDARSVDIDAHGREGGDPPRTLPLLLEIAPTNVAGSGVVELALSRLGEQTIDVFTGLAENCVYVMAPKGSTGQYADRIVGMLPKRPAPADLRLDVVSSDGNARVPLAATLSALGRALSIAGQQETYLSDVDVDVANKVSLANPNVTALFSGVALRIASTPDLADGHVFDVTLVSHLRRGGRTQLQTRAQQIPSLSMLDFRLDSVASSLHFAKDAQSIPLLTLTLPQAETDVLARVDASLR